MSENKVTTSRKKSFDIASIILIIVIAVLCAVLVFVSFFALRIVSGSSMDTTLSTGQYVLIDKSSEAERGEIIVFELDDTAYIKRVIAVGGDTIRFVSGGTTEYGQTIACTEMYLGGEWTTIDESYLSEDMLYSSTTFAYSLNEEIVIGENEYFVMGDNRNNSEDSRKTKIGIISTDDVSGNVVVVAQMGGFLEWLFKLIYWAW